MRSHLSNENLMGRNWQQFCISIIFRYTKTKSFPKLLYFLITVSIDKFLLLKGFQIWKIVFQCSQWKVDYLKFTKLFYAHGSFWGSNSFISKTTDFTSFIRVSADKFLCAKLLHKYIAIYVACIGTLIRPKWQKMQSVMAFITVKLSFLWNYRLNMRQCPSNFLILSIFRHINIWSYRLEFFRHLHRDDFRQYWVVSKNDLLFFAAYVICKKNYSFSRVVFFQTKIANSFDSKINDNSRLRTTRFSSSRFGVRVTVEPNIFTIDPQYFSIPEIFWNKEGFLYEIFRQRQELFDGKSLYSPSYP